MSPVRTIVALVFLVAASAWAQSTVPVLTRPFPEQALAPGGAAVTIDVRNFFSVPGVSGAVAQFDTVMGRFNIELLSNDAPRSVANFLNYVSSGRYQNTSVHRAVTDFVIQGGGYTATVPYAHIPTFAPVQNEFKLPNLRGTLAMAKQGGDPNSATSEWFVNLADNRANLDNQNGGFTVFARVLGSGMSVVDAIAALPRANIGFDATGQPPSTPVRNVPANETQMRPEYYVTVTDVKVVTLFPTGGGPSVIELSVENSSPAVVTTVLSGSTLTMTPGAAGTATITVRAVDTNGNATQGTFTVVVAATVPAFTSQPMSQTVATGSTVVFNAPATGAASYRWERNGVAIPGATTGTLVINNVATTDTGNYANFATNSIGITPSDSASLTVVTVDPTSVGRLVNLSILTTAGAGAKILTMGAVIGAGSAGTTLPLVIRGVGPTLAQPPFNVPGVLADPIMTFYAAGVEAPLESNDDWGGGAALSAAFRSVGAFDLPAGSRDSAIARTTPGVTPGGYTVQVAGKGAATGVVIAEMYDASATTRTAATPRLINLSTRAEIDPNTDLAVGFVLGGQTARSVLVRGVGPSLAQFGISGVMANPRLELFNNSTGQRIALNDDWGASLEIAAAAAAVGAFPLISGSSQDAVLLVTLPPGPYSARVSGVGGAGGAAIVEVYEVP